MLVKLQTSQEFYKKSSNIKFDKNPRSGISVVLYGQTDEQTNVTMLTVDFRTFSLQLKKED
jgi:hypothetical protein